MTIVVFVLLLIGGPPDFKLLDSTVFKHNMATFERCEEVRELVKERMKNITRDAFHNIIITPCYEMEINEKAGTSL